MSDPKIVTDKSPKFLLGVQRDVMNSQRYVGGVDLSVWGQPFEVGTLKYLGGSKDGQTIPTSDYTVSAPDTDYSVVVTLNTALTDGRVNWVSAPSGYGVVKISNTQWKLCKTIVLTVVGGIEDGIICSFEPRSNRLSSGWIGFASGTGVTPTPTPTTSPDGSVATAALLDHGAGTTSTDASGVLTLCSLTTGDYAAAVIIKNVGASSSTISMYASATPVGPKPITISPDQTVRGVLLFNEVSTVSEALRLRVSATQPRTANLVVWGPTVEVGNYAGRSIPLGATIVDAVIGEIAADGSRTVTLASDAPGLTWSGAPSGWEAVKNSNTQYTLKYTGTVTNPTLVEADLDSVIKSNEQLEVRGGLTIYNNLTINGKLYITQELGF